MLLMVTLVGIAGWLFAALVVRSSPVRSGVASGRGSSTYLAAVLAPAAMIVAAQSGRPPASSLWSIGLALGALGGLSAEYVSALGRRRRTSLLGSTATIAASPFAAVAVVSGTLLWAKGPVVEALATIPVAWLTVSLALACCRLGYGRPHRTGVDAEPVAGPEDALGAGFAVTLAAAAALGIYRGGESDALHWTSAALTFAASAPVALLFGSAAASLTQREAKHEVAIAWQAFLCAGFLAAVSAVLAPRVFGPGPLIGLMAMGLGLGFVLWWVVTDMTGAVADRFPAAGLNARLGMPVAVLLVLGAFMAAFSLFAGYGVGVMLLAAWLVFATAARPAAAAAEAGPSPDSPQADQSAVALRLASLFALATILLLFRLITTRFEGDLSGVVLTDHFALVGFLVGAALPTLLSGVLEPAAAAGAWYVVRFVVSLAVAAAVPGVMLAVWGSKVALALVAGLALSTVAFYLGGGPATFTASLDVGRRAVVVPAGWFAPWYALIVTAAVTAWMHPIAQIATRSRADRARLLSWALAVLIAAVVFCGVSGRIATRRGRRDLPRAEPSPQGGTE